MRKMEKDFLAKCSIENKIPTKVNKNDSHFAGLLLHVHINHKFGINCQSAPDWKLEGYRVMD